MVMIISLGIRPSWMYRWGPMDLSTNLKVLKICGNEYWYSFTFDVITHLVFDVFFQVFFSCLGYVDYMQMNTYNSI